MCFVLVLVLTHFAGRTGNFLVDKLSPRGTKIATIGWCDVTGLNLSCLASSTCCLSIGGVFSLAAALAYDARVCPILILVLPSAAGDTDGLFVRKSETDSTEITSVAWCTVCRLEFSCFAILTRRAAILRILTFAAGLTTYVWVCLVLVLVQPRIAN